MASHEIVIKGAREHNLRDVSLTLPRGALICFTGVSGSGKSSLAFDTLYAEGQRRYVESLSSYARQFLGQMPKPQVDRIDGLSPSIAIQQKTGGRNPRSTVGTITEIHDYLRVLYARIGQGYCPDCQIPVEAQTREQIVERIFLELPEGTSFQLLAPIVRGQKGEHKDLLTELSRAGYVRARVDGQILPLSETIPLDRNLKHSIEVVIDRLKVAASIRGRLTEAVEASLTRGDGTLIIAVDGKPDRLLSANYSCAQCGASFDPPSPQLFSFNSPRGMCLACDGLGVRHDFAVDLLIPDSTLSVAKGAIAPIGPIKEIGKWRKHIYEGVAENIEAGKDGPKKGTLLNTPWADLDQAWRDVWLRGTGDRRMVFRWRSKGRSWSHVETWPGFLNELMSKFKESREGPARGALEEFMRSTACTQCGGGRLNPQAQATRVGGKTLVELAAMPIGQAARFFDGLAGESGADAEASVAPLDALGLRIGEELLKEIRARLGFLVDVGLHYLSLDRLAPTLSGGEAQRIRLASQVGAGLVGVLYILDEPSIGLHPRDNDRLLATLRRLRDQGNTVIVVEHDEDTMRAADVLVDFGPGPGIKGGEIISAGGIDQLMEQAQSITGAYLSGRKSIEIPQRKTPDPQRWLRVIGARQNNLKGIDVAIPLGLFVAVTGVSGSGKSSLVGEILRDTLARDLNGAASEPGLHDRIEGVEMLDKVIDIDQSPIGRTPRSNPATYIKLFDLIRDLYAKLPDAKTRGYAPGRFSFNVEGGRCEACQGNGSNKLEMDFLADVWVTCPVCEGRRFNRETLHVRFKGKSISDVLQMDVQEALEHFANVPKIATMLQTLHDVGLDYIKIGQPSPTLSGGEAQRIKLAKELVKRGTGKTLYILDEPTTGLHFDDISKLLSVLHSFTALGNSVVVIEHNLDVIKTADWVIDLGPEGGEGGGRVVAEGMPEVVAEQPESYTGRSIQKHLVRERMLKANLAAGDDPARESTKRGKQSAVAKGKAKAKGEAKVSPVVEIRRFADDAETPIEIFGARQHNLKGIDVAIPRHAMTVCSGPSGSGKSSLAIDTLYAEGQRRYVESLSSYARQFLSPLQKPKVDQVRGLAPAICIEQQTTSKSPRSTVGTVTEIHDYWRILFARLGHAYCPKCHVAVGTQTADEIIEKILHHPEGTRVYIMAPVHRVEGEDFEQLWNDLRNSGFARVRVDRQSHSLDDPPKLSARRKHQIEVVVDRATIRRDSRSRLADSVESALDLGRGIIQVAVVGDPDKEASWPVTSYSLHRVCDQCGRSFEELSPHHFSFNSPLGWCPVCQGLGVQQGANPAELIPSGALSLAEGAVEVWPRPGDNALFDRMLTSLARHHGFALETPFDELEASHRRLLLHGGDNSWITVPASDVEPGFSFQFKGLFPAIDEAARVSFYYRYKLQGMVDEVPCVGCMGGRLRDDAAAVRFKNHTLDEISRWPLGKTLQFVKSLKLGADEKHIAGDLAREILDRLQFLVDVGLDYLSLGRSTPTLSGGESQRIRLASQIGSGLTGVLYILDEPTIGLHPRDNTRLLNALKRLRDLGNTLVVVEHDREVIEAADYLLDFGPGAGAHGGQITAAGAPAKVRKSKASLTGMYLMGARAIPIPSELRPNHGPAIEVHGARQNNLKNISARFPLGCVTVVTGVSGSGKSTLVEDILARAAAKKLHRSKESPGAHDRIENLDKVDKVIRVDQAPIGNTPTSNPATYSGAFDLIRDLFAKLPTARAKGFTSRRFSFNQPGGRCEACEGNGQKRIEMHFLPDVWVECEACQGRRYSPATLEVTYKGKSIADVLAMPLDEALELFKAVPRLRRTLQTLQDVGLGYLAMGQPANTLSGGEAQRVKLAAELARPDTGRTLYILDEPTTGLHVDDVRKLLDVVHRLADLGNTIVIIEHNLEVIKTADWVVDLGPEAGTEGGRIVVAGTPSDVVKVKQSRTGVVLKPILASSPVEPPRRYDKKAAEKKIQDEARQAREAEKAREVAQPEQAASKTFSAHQGRRWHTGAHPARNGRPTQWEGKLLDHVVTLIESIPGFEPTDWSNRSGVKIRGNPSDHATREFFHALTGNEWVATLKFHLPPRTTVLGKLERQLRLASFDQSPVPVRCDAPRIQVEQAPMKGQVITILVHLAADVMTPAFEMFVREAAAAFLKSQGNRERAASILPSAGS